MGNNMACAINCKHRIAAKMCTPYTWCQVFVNTLHKVINNNNNNNNNNGSIYDYEGVELNSRFRTAVQNLFNILILRLYLQFAVRFSVNHSLLIPSHISKDKMKQKEIV
jgi:hypothetical protein